MLPSAAPYDKTGSPAYLVEISRFICNTRFEDLPSPVVERCKRLIADCFAIITAALISGAIVERKRFGAYLIFVALWTLAEYLRADSMSKLVRGMGADNQLPMRLSAYVLATRLDQTWIGMVASWTR